MRGQGTLLLLAGALIVSIFSVFGGDNYSRLESVRESLSSQRAKNSELEQYVDSLRHEVNGLQTNDRVLEKAARNELGMARPNEMVIFFDDKDQKQN